ncbi:hypothetical protein HUE87_11420 [Candidatus Sulfurimonas marisnigri]|uniref:DUF2846 domain-containing protein n=1 Tax=Candidatus Sulfurimonas marisnigri TaxID=2740405 RepID=A0A7S7M057_9BACT|nr:hypothetical protein [Candidatus Sulfurimonas marisnigri]QOY54470.1 hypothetical protein HUE87_11420 [Candidatus Sulfurimonas marisnigri]
MKNLLLKSTILLILLVFTACSSKVAFAKQEPLQGASLVYVYVPQFVSTGENGNMGSYKIRINNKRVESKIFEGEYQVFNLKPEKISISVTKDGIEERKLQMDFKEGESYYLRVINDVQNNNFSFVQAEKGVALKEIAKTGLSGSRAIELDNIITELVTPDEKQESTPIVSAPLAPKPAVQKVQIETLTTSSKMDEVKKAYQLKVDGILSEDEFTKLKAEILAK